MDEKRMGEIALALVKDEMEQNGLRKLDSSSIKRAIGNLSERTGISRKEFTEFGEIIVMQVVKESFEQARKKD
ncbi:MAG: hypothetical protein PHY30_03690 [Candidatus Pacebacteria bacterium]|nr:hypothetical protein [Candidatus Paceibacterota bacterium]